MIKCKISFEGSVDEIKIYTRGMDMYIAIIEACNLIRSRTKNDITEDEETFLENLRETLYISEVDEI